MNYNKKFFEIFLVYLILNLRIVLMLTVKSQNEYKNIFNIK